jgi:hypothetical protein
LAVKKNPERTGVLSIRLRESDRQHLITEAQKLGVPVSVHTFNLLCRGIEASKKAGLTETPPAAERSEKPRIPETVKPQRQEGEPTVKPKEPKAPGSTGPIDENFLAGAKAKYPGINHALYLSRLSNVSRETGKLITRKAVEKVFALVTEREGKG